MRGTFLFPSIVLFAALVSVKADEIDDLKTLKYFERINQALRIFFPTNIVKQTPQSDSSNRSNRTECAKQLMLLKEGLMNNSIWALKMLDASSKIPSGLIMGNPIDLGMYDECIAVNVNVGGQNIRGRHCMYNVIADIVKLPFSETLSICLPATCEAEDVQAIVQTSITLFGQVVGTNSSISIGRTTCSTVDPAEWTPGGIVTLTGLSLLLLFLVLCTICDIFTMYYVKPLPDGRLDVLRQFSLYSNAVRILSTRTSPQTLPAVQGLRFFSMCWVIYGHTNMMFFPQTVNLVDVVKWIPTWNSLHLLIAPFSVDSFFAISGVLMSYIFLKEMSTGRGFNLFTYYLHRYLRLTPALVALILITIFISPRLGSGAVWENNAQVEEEACRSSWWTMPIYIHNYIKMSDNICLGHTWYLADEMQFFWISPLILYPLSKKPKIGLGILAAFFVASVVTPVKIGYDNQYSTAMIVNHHALGPNGFVENFYLVSHTRAAPWLVGMFFGYLIFTQKGSSASKATKWIGWLLAVAAFSFCVFTMRIFQNENYVYDDVWEAFYTALARPLWGFGVSWVMYACVRGFGGPVSTFLSYSIYTPLSRISYCVYLVHFEIQFMKARAARTSGYFSAMNALDRFFSDLSLSIIVGFIFTLVFESPFLVLEGIIKKRCRRMKNDSKKVRKVDDAERGCTSS